MKVSIIIPNYNGEKLLEKNLPKVFEAIDYYNQQANNDVEIIVVDDCSTDNSLNEIQNAKIKSHLPVVATALQAGSLKLEVKILINEKNLGFSPTVNRGVKKSNGEVIILLNTDVAPEKEFLKPLLNHFIDPNLFAVGCMDKSIEHGKVILRGRGIGKWQRGFLIHARGEVDKTNTLWVNGGSGAFRKTIWEKLEGFNELYAPFYWEDIDLSYRALKAGYTIRFEPKSIVVHEHIEGAIKSKYSEQEIKKIAYRNQFIFVWLNATDIFVLLSHFLWLPYYVCFMLFKKELIFFRSFVDACGLLAKVISLRKTKIKQFIKTDYQVTKIFLNEFN